MADAALTMPDGTSFRVLERPANPSHGPLVMEFVLPKDCQAPPPHVHPGGQTETFEVVEGAFELLVGREWKRVDAGESMEIPPGTRHTFRNRNQEPARVRDVHDPAHSFESYIRRLHAIIAASGAGRPTAGALVRLAMLWREHADTIQITDPPARAGLALLAGFGRLARVRLPD